MLKSGLFITGTDTGVGKTFVCSLILSALHSFGVLPFYFKPIQTGTDCIDGDDTQTAQLLAGLMPHQILGPVYSFPAPQAPSRAADLVGESIQLSHIQAVWDGASADLKVGIVEGAGGVLVPLNKNQTILDLIDFFNLPVLVVASTRLGTINHTLMTLQILKNRGLTVQGLVLVGPSDEGLGSLLESFGKVPVIAEVPWVSSIDAQSVRQLATEVFSKKNLGFLIK